MAEWQTNTARMNQKSCFMFGGRILVIEGSSCGNIDALCPLRHYRAHSLTHSLTRVEPEPEPVRE